MDKLNGVVVGSKSMIRRIAEAESVPDTVRALIREPTEATAQALADQFQAAADNATGPDPEMGVTLLLDAAEAVPRLLADLNRELESRASLHLPFMAPAAASCVP